MSVTAHQFQCRYGIKDSAAQSVGQVLWFLFADIFQYSSFLNHIIYSSGQKDTKQNRAGAGAIIEIAKSVNILNETDGKLTIPETSIIERNNNTQATIIESVNAENVTVSTPQTGNSFVINININCSVSDLDNLAGKINNLLNNLSQ